MGKFQVGDHVRCVVGEHVDTREVYTDDINGGAGWEEGREFIVYEINNHGGRAVLWANRVDGELLDVDGNHLDGGIYDDWCVLASEVETEVEIEIEEVTKGEVKVPSNEIIGQEKNVKLVTLAGKHNIPALLIGDTGTGKTTMVKFIAEKENKQWVRFNLTGETTVDDFVGKFTLKGGETIWQDGILLQAMKKGEWLVVDEINVALPEILFVLHSLLDDDRFVVVANNDGKIVRPHPDFRFFATMNPVSEYSGTKELNKAFQSRFGVIVNVDYPDPGTEAVIVHAKTGIGMEHATMMADLGLALRNAKTEDKIFYTCSTRDLIQWAQLAIHTDIKTAFECTVLNKSNGDAPSVKKIASAIIKGYKDLKALGYTANVEEIRKEWDKIKSDRAELDETKLQVEARKRAVEELAHELLQPKHEHEAKAVARKVVKKAAKKASK